MSEFYSQDCEKWARRMLKTARFRGQARLVKIQPRSGRVIGGAVSIPGGKKEYPAWYYHWAVEFNGYWHDEAYPNGISIAEFRSRFEYELELEFIVSS